jgi:hypothetical protein
LSADLVNKEPADDVPSLADEAIVEPAGSRRRLVEIRCGFAEMARKEAEAGALRVVEAKQLYDDQAAVVALAQAAIDPAATQAAKDEAHRNFRATVSAARGRGQVEVAASAWLAEINKINGQSRAVQARTRREGEAGGALLAELVRLSDTAEASAAMAETAMEACRSARVALDAPDAMGTGNGVESPTAAQPESETPEARSAAEAGSPTATTDLTPSAAPTKAAPGTQFGPPAEEERQSTDWLAIDIRAPQPQAIMRLFRRDARTMGTLVDQLAGSDVKARRSWQLLLSTFVDSVVAAAIEDGRLEFPKGNPFWDQFSAAEARAVVRGLAALGFRYDGFETFSDGRVPMQRDLAMAVGSAGLLPVRVRHWPTQDEATDLFRGVRANADEFIAAGAPALTLGELVRLLGRRAELLADLWNEWPRVRPLLFSTNP